MTGLQFESLQDLWRMNGHGPFVWSAYTIAVLVVIALLVIPRVRELREIARIRARERRAAQRVHDEEKA